jgi:hypothetical protein
MHIKDRLAFAAIELLKDENGAEEMKLLLESYTSKKNTGNFFREYKKRCVVYAPVKPSDIVDEISRQLDAFELFTPERFVCKDTDE